MAEDLLKKFEGKHKISVEDAENLVELNLASFQNFGGLNKYIFGLNGCYYVKRDDTFEGRGIFYDLLRSSND